MIIEGEHVPDEVYLAFLEQAVRFIQHHGLEQELRARMEAEGVEVGAAPTHLGTPSRHAQAYLQLLLNTGRVAAMGELE